MFPGLWFGCFLIRDPDGRLTAGRKGLQHPVSFSLQDMA
jgi:RNA polymerase subunit RPABC4/transcription elongation factor Spt4